MSQDPTDAHIKLILGSQLGNFKPIKYIGKGHFSYVFRALECATGKNIALKVEKPGAGAEAQIEFDNEGTLLAKLRRCHGVINYIESGTAQLVLSSHVGDIPFPLRYHALELADENLENLLVSKDWGRTLWKQRFAMWRGYVVGIHQMHRHDIAHRDLKSGNCLVVLNRSSFATKVSDLGRSRDLSALASHSPFMYAAGMGDFDYAPPEFLWWQGKDKRLTHCAADLYGLGSLLFEIVMIQGITTYALGPGYPIHVANRHLAGSPGSIDLGSLRSRFEPAFDIFGKTLPGGLQ